MEKIKFMNIHSISNKLSVMISVLQALKNSSEKYLDISSSIKVNDTKKDTLKKLEDMIYDYENSFDLYLKELKSLKNKILKLLK